MKNSFFNTFVKRSIQSKAVCLILLFLSFFSGSLLATELNISQLVATQINDYEYEVQGYVTNQAQTPFAGTPNFTVQIKDQFIKIIFFAVIIPPLDSSQFRFTVTLNVDYHSDKNKRPLTDKLVNENINNSNGNQKYETVLICVTIDESNNNNKTCVFTIPLDEFQLKLESIGGRKGRILQQNPNSEFDNNIDLSFKVYPNPMVGITYLAINSLKKRFVCLQIANSQGQTVKQYETFIPEGSEFIEVDMNEFGPGIYFFKVTGSDEAVTSTAIKTNK